MTLGGGEEKERWGELLRRFGHPRKRATLLVVLRVIATLMLIGGIVFYIILLFKGKG